VEGRVQVGLFQHAEHRVEEAGTRELRAARHHLSKRQPCRHAPPDGVADGALLAGVPLQLAMEPSDRAAQDIREKPGCTGCGAIRGGQWLLL
jgi:hypothetical protein